MAVHTHVSAETKAARAALRKLQVQVSRDVEKGVDEALKPLLADIDREVAAVMPHGYAAVLAPAMRYQVTKRTVTARGVSLDVRVYARSRREFRDIPRLDSQGRLRHPLFGNRNFWYTTQVRPGFVTRPADALQRRAVNETNRWVSISVDNFNRGA
jgi:hypothetical protein